MKVLVTGGGGFVGSHLAEALVHAGHDVRIVDNFSTGRRSNVMALPEEVELVEGDLTSYERAYNSVRGCEVVLHQAALPSVPRSIQDPLTSNASNITGLLNVLLASRDLGVRRVVYASSSSVYGANAQLPKREDMAVEPISPYAVAKLAGEGYCRSFSRVYGLETVSLRYFNVFGPRQDPRSQYAAVIPSFISTVLAGGRPTVYGDGGQSRDFTYVDNVVAANILAMDSPQAPGRLYNIACGQRVTILELLSELSTLLDVDIEPELAAPRAGEVRHSHADLGRAQAELGYFPAVTLRDGLERTVTHLREKARAGSAGMVGA
jgi:UDP-N-acetylglucosamine/UDP-N-acetyl-alpha-D-glucosaminouronate 4-epimerase